MTTPSAMDQAACDAWLAAEHEGLRGECRHQKSQGEPPACDCHRYGYVSKVDLEGLLVAMKKDGWTMYEPTRESQSPWIWGWRKGNLFFIGEADNPLLAASRAAVAARRKEAP